MSIKEQLYYCPLPWFNLTVSTDGTSVPCCRYHLRNGKSDERGWKDNSIFQAVREDMQNNIPHEGCNMCWRDEAEGKDSYRKQALKWYDKLDIDYNADTPTRLDLKLNNHCNLKCRMCKPWSSNQIQKEFREIGERPLSNPDMDRYFHQFDNFGVLSGSNRRDVVEDLKPYIPTLQQLYATGGEPFLNTDFLRLLEYCVETGFSRDIQLSIITNGTILNDRLLQYFNSFKRVKICVSIDGTGLTYEYIRHQASWDMVNQNIERLKQEYQSDQLTLSTSIVPQLYNMLNLEEVIRWGRTVTTRGDAPVHKVSWLGTPYFLHVRNAPPELKEIARIQLERFLPFCQTQYEQYIVQGVLDDLAKTQLVEDWERFCDYTRILDIKRHQSINDFIPQLGRFIYDNK